MPEKKKTGRDFPLAPTPNIDSAKYYKRVGDKAAYEMQAAISAHANRVASGKMIQADKDAARQAKKGKPGYDKMGFPLKKS
jgi:hypothetical protein